MPATAYISELSAPDANGHVRVVDTRHIPDADVSGRAGG
jgi:hypothetical protein